jgi:hypothetical protein
MFNFGSPKRPASAQTASIQTSAVSTASVQKTRTTKAKKSSIPMTGEIAVFKRETRPKWVRWIIDNGRVRRDWRPGFFHETAPAGYAAEGSSEEVEMKESVLKDADEMSKS